MCGEKAMIRHYSRLLAGSPPRVRGKEFSGRAGDCRGRITPACAGKSCRRSRRRPSSRDHPRVCGEKAEAWRINLRCVGSPPRVRGKVTRYFEPKAVVGITPACAGKSQITSVYPSQTKDHPRVCGEKREAQRVWVFHRRITPACAGKSIQNSRRQTAQSDHPRVCGEKLGLTAGTLDLQGSPPRVRGKAHRHRVPEDPPGITPACAGKRLHPVLHPRWSWDHPRVCGEKQILKIIAKGQQGSPPRVRGKVQHCPHGRQRNGITPACAGKSPFARGSLPHLRDHPRVCGEKRDWRLLLVQAVGSPPRVRGKVDGIEKDANKTGITPACAGKRQLM